MSQSRMMLLELRTGRTRPMRQTKPLLTSADQCWHGVLVEEHPPDTWESKDVALLNSAVYLTLDRGASLEWRAHGWAVSKRIYPGQISILPADDRYSVKLRAAGGSLVVSLDQRLLTRAGVEMGQIGNPRPVWAHAVEDGLLRELVLGLRSELRRGSRSNHSYVQSLVAALAAHVVRQYSADGLHIPNSRGGLSHAVLSRTIQHIHEHLAEHLSLESLAEVAQLSSCHFARMFRLSTGMTPRSYVQHCRVSFARRLLAGESRGLADVALEAGFCDQGHMTRCFREVLGTTPAAVARNRRASERDFNQHSAS